MYYIYAIKSVATNKIYIGQTQDLAKRLLRHNLELPSKSRSYTKLNNGPWELVYKEEVLSRQEAMMREKQLKSAKGRQFIKNLI